MTFISKIGSVPQRLLLAACLFTTGITFTRAQTGQPSVEDLAKLRAKENAEAGEAIVKLSPFEVVADEHGYYSANTTSGTRIGSKLEDLGASITVVTKEQMNDFAMLDINDIFNYEANTEGTGNYTDFSFNRNGQATSNAQLEPTNANRIRGISAANVTLGNFATSGWTPIDPLNIDAVEISRGPNSSIFGIGNAGGSVNTVPAEANLQLDKTQLTTRGDSNDGFRETVDINRVVVPGVFALRGSVAYQHDGYHLKPSGTDTVRYNAMVKYVPFKNTRFTASFSTYDMHGNRPNVTTPRDGITDWLARGSPTWDPTTLSAKINGAVVATSIPTYFTYDPMRSYSNIYIDRTGLSYWQTGQATDSTNPNIAASPTRRLVNVVGAPQYTSQPLFSRSSGLTSKAIYDWSSLNLASMNHIQDKSKIATALLDHTFIDNQQQLLALQLGYFHEEGKRYARNIVGGASGISSVDILQVDVNETNIDGSPNPYFGRPFLGQMVPNISTSEINNDTYRAQLLYKMDFRLEKNWLRWLGMHQITGYAEYKKFVARSLAYRDVIVDQHTWLGQNVAHAGLGGAIGGLAAGPNIAGGYFRYYLGDKQGANIDYNPGDLTYGSYTMNYGNSASGFVKEAAAIGPAVVAANGSNDTLTVLKSQGAILQSHFLDDRIVTTLGMREDQRYGRLGTPVRLLPDGVNIDPVTYTQWQGGDWAVGKGPTRSAGIVLKPLHWLSFYANKSDSFQPNVLAQDLYLNRLPDPTGKGEDYGFVLNLMNGKLNVRVNKYTTSVLKTRNGESGTLAQRVQRVDFLYNAQGARDVFQLQTQATGWVTAAAAAQGTTLTADQVETQVANIMKLPVQYMRPFASGVSETDDSLAKGLEIEANYNPTNFWTVTFNVAQQQAIGAHIAADLRTWLDQRIAVWQTIIDPTINRPWYTEPYNNGQSAQQFVAGNITAPLNLYTALEGKSKPQIRKYRANFSTNFRLAAITSHPILKRFSIGGAVRWEDKGAIGYYGLQQLPNLVTDLDPERPVYDKAHYYIDTVISYRTPMFSDRVMATFQFNVRNANENGRLQPLAANPDGTPTAYRIVEPRVFILSASFDMGGSRRTFR